MPLEKSRGSSKSSKKKRSFWDRIPGSRIASQTTKDLGNIAQSTPGAVLQTGDQLYDIAFGSSKEKTDAASELTRAQIQAIKDLRHPLRNPGYSLLTILGLVPIPGAATGKVASLGRAVRGTKKAPRKPKRRSISYKIKTEKEAEQFGRAKPPRGSIKGYTPGFSVITEDLPAAKNITARSAQNLIDYLRPKVSQKAQKRKVKKAIARRQDLEARLFENDPLGLMASFKEAGSKASRQSVYPLRRGEVGAKERGKAAYELLVREPNALIRALRLYRGAYILPNRLGAETVDLIDAGNPLAYLKGVLEQRRFRKKNPLQAKMVDRMGGETISEAAFGGGSGPIGTAARGVAQLLNRYTDQPGRARTFMRKVKQESGGQDPLAILNAAFNGNEAALATLVRAADRAENASLRFTRSGRMRDAETGKQIGPLGVGEAADKFLADNLFLYKFLTASGRYGGYTVAEHPTLAAFLAAQGQEAPNIFDIMEEVPEFMEGRLPWGEKESAGGGRMLPTTVGAQAASLYDYPFEVLNTLMKVPGDPREITDIFNPVQAAGGNAAFAFDPFRDQELITQNNPDAGLLERLGFGAATQLRSIPWREWAEINDSPEEQEGRLFQTDPWEIFVRQLVAGGLLPVRTDPEVAKNLAPKKRTGKKRKRKRRASTDF